MQRAVRIPRPPSVSLHWRQHSLVGFAQHEWPPANQLSPARTLRGPEHAPGTRDRRVRLAFLMRVFFAERNQLASSNLTMSRYRMCQHCAFLFYFFRCSRVYPCGNGVKNHLPIRRTIIINATLDERHNARVNVTGPPGKTQGLGIRCIWAAGVVCVCVCVSGTLRSSPDPNSRS